MPAILEIGSSQNTVFCPMNYCKDNRFFNDH